MNWRTKYKNVNNEFTKYGVNSGVFSVRSPRFFVIERNKNGRAAESFIFSTIHSRSREAYYQAHEEWGRCGSSG